MDSFSDDLRIVTGAYKRTFDATRKFDEAFDAALEAYCAEKGLPANLRSKVDVGVLIAELQVRSRWQAGEPGPSSKPV